MRFILNDSLQDLHTDRSHTHTHTLTYTNSYSLFLSVSMWPHEDQLKPLLMEKHFTHVFCLSSEYLKELNLQIMFVSYGLF